MSLRELDDKLKRIGGPYRRVMLEYTSWATERYRWKCSATHISGGETVNAHGRTASEAVQSLAKRLEVQL